MTENVPCASHLSIALSQSPSSHTLLCDPGWESLNCLSQAALPTDFFLVPSRKILPNQPPQWLHQFEFPPTVDERASFLPCVLLVCFFFFKYSYGAPIQTFRVRIWRAGAWASVFSKSITNDQHSQIRTLF